MPGNDIDQMKSQYIFINQAYARTLFLLLNSDVFEWTNLIKVTTVDISQVPMA